MVICDYPVRQRQLPWLMTMFSTLSSAAVVNNGTCKAAHVMLTSYIATLTRHLRCATWTRKQKATGNNICPPVNWKLIASDYDDANLQWLPLKWLFYPKQCHSPSGQHLLYKYHYFFLPCFVTIHYASCSMLCLVFCSLFPKYKQ